MFIIEQEVKCPSCTEYILILKRAKQLEKEEEEEEVEEEASGLMLLVTIASLLANFFFS